MGCMHPSLMVELTIVDMLIGGAAPGQVGCDAVPHVVSAGLLEGRVSSHMVGCTSWAGAGSLEGGRSPAKK